MTCDLVSGLDIYWLRPKTTYSDKNRNGHVPVVLNVILGTCVMMSQEKL